MNIMSGIFILPQLDTFVTGAGLCIFGVWVMSRRSTPRATPRPSKEADIVFKKSSACFDCSRPSGLLHWDDIAEWRRDNDYILTGYRPDSYSCHGSFRSIFEVHNETVNIHSHLWGGVLFLFQLIYFPATMANWSSRITRTDVALFSVYFAGVLICFLMSSTYHVLANHSPNVAIFGNQLDYLGVLILMWGASIPTIYYGFWEDHGLQKLYWSTTSILALACGATTLHPKFRTAAFRVYRTIMYTSFGFSALAFSIHAVVLHGWEKQLYRMSLQWMLCMAGFNLVGICIYTLRIPERWYPTRFDIYGSSHQIMHFMVVFAGLAHTIGLVKACKHIHGVE